MMDSDGPGLLRVERLGSRTDYNWQVVPFGQLAGEKFNLVADRRVAVDQDNILAIDTAAAAMDAIARFAQQFFLAHLNIHRFGPDDQVL